MKKALTLCVAVILMVSIVLAGCSNSDNSASQNQTPVSTTSSSDGNKSNENQQSNSNVNPAGVLPIVKEKETLDIMIVGRPSVEDFDTNEFTKWLEEQTNIDLNLQVIPQEGSAEKINLVLASGTYPDVLLGFNLTPAQQAIYGGQGVFLPLNDLIEKYGIETKRAFAENPTIRDVITAPDGNIYSLPNINVCYHCLYDQKMWLNQEWMDTLGLDTPTTTEEFYQVLKAFKERDPNGNGIADEIPLSTVNGGLNSNQHVASFLMNSFIYKNPYHNSSGIFLDNGKVDIAYNKPEFREGLRYIHKLYDEGLIYDQSFTQDPNQHRLLGENPDVVILGGAPGLHPGTFVQTYGDNGRYLLYEAIPPLTGPEGVRLTPYNPYPFITGTFIITKDAKNPEVAFRFADFLYNEETSISAWSGIKDKDWSYVTTGEPGVNGKPAIWTTSATFGTTQNAHWAQAGMTYSSSDLRLGVTPENGQAYNIEVILYEATKKYEPYAVEIDKIIPPLFFTNEESAEFADLQNTINTHVNEMIARFTIGDVSLDNDWDSYIKQLDNMNLKRYLEIYQTAYDRQFKK